MAKKFLQLKTNFWWND